MPVAFSATLAVPPEVTDGVSLTAVTVIVTDWLAVLPVPSVAVTWIS